MRFDRGARVLIEDGPDLFTGEVLGVVGILLGECWRSELLYVVALDGPDGRALLVCECDLWPESRELPDLPADDVGDGVHEWTRP